MIESIALPGLHGKTVVVLDAGDGHGPAVCGSLIASGVTVIGLGTGAELPASLVDAGTGLDGELHYHQLTEWAGAAEWIRGHADRVDGIVGDSDGVTAGTSALGGLLVAGACAVSIGAKAGPGIRSSAVLPAGGRGSRHEDVGAAVAFLISDLAELVDGAVIPVGERPADKV